MNFWASSIFSADWASFMPRWPLLRGGGLHVLLCDRAKGCFRHPNIQLFSKFDETVAMLYKLVVSQLKICRLKKWPNLQGRLEFIWRSVFSYIFFFVKFLVFEDLAEIWKTLIYPFGQGHRPSAPSPGDSAPRPQMS